MARVFGKNRVSGYSGGSTTGVFIRLNGSEELGDDFMSVTRTWLKADEEDVQLLATRNGAAVTFSDRSQAASFLQENNNFQ